MMKIISLGARKILNSNGNWTVEAEVETGEGVFKASVPSGTSKGKYEAVEIAPERAVENIERIIVPKLKGKEIGDQKEIDHFLIKLDGTENKSKLGANAILAVSIACLRAGAVAKKIPLYSYISQICRGRASANLPMACFNILNGGVHGGNDLDIQEFMIIPQMGSFRENLKIGAEIYQTLKKILEKKFGKSAANLGDEGGFAPPLNKTKDALELIMKAIKSAGYSEKVKIGLDCAASEFFSQGKYNFEGEKVTAEELLKFYQGLLKKYPILFFEDPFEQDDWQSWKSFRYKLQTTNYKLFVVGDDLTVTNPQRIKQAYKKKACSAVIIKPNQIGTVTETIEAAKLAKEFEWKIIVSHRSGDTCDDFIADLAVGISADFIKSGASARGERVAKYNRLLKIEEQLLGS
ncbi:phosphopyruvate hydratase [bacterium (Candidatus Gribaldobacteria) CG_4_9_14_3_um_filter_36_15]|uniref:Enolase n=3 Tax=Candidatus Gribaldobacteria TaxID=2798536 RepID=A0A2M7VK22_9BACT|nr:phosphopyruvate hydratase [Candidatus Kuenenbacteria bacterium]PJA02116.1 MAG: phosphopyruvate hydratase [bacterium (Candidatus Gribaldobacteria) CG_4_10_14_0_2_um_filter_36_18]PJB09389.1 MAG: phosphopyruvate hydratase [bacterium (Candidatus Gribaldobacteria) CG_4_9_14_3_um_filter_36_15]